MASVKQNPALLIGILLPFIFIAILAAAVIYPSLSIKPAHNFLYTTDNYGNYPVAAQAYQNKFVVTNGKLALQPLMTITSSPQPVVAAPAAAPTLFLYDVTTKSSHEISLADAEALTLDPGPTSPDGYTVNYQYGNDGIFGLFGGDSGSGSQGFFISKGDTSRRLTGIGDAGDIYPNNFQLIGWVQ